MPNRSIVAAAISTVFFACAAPYSTVASDDAASSKADATTTSTNGTKPTTTTATAKPSPLDGTWDITSDSLAPSQITFDGNTVTGLLVYAVDGDPQDVCMLTQHHAKFTFVVTGNGVKGTIDDSYSYIGDGCAPSHSLSQVTGFRGKTAPGATPFEGEWTFERDEDPSIGVSIAGLLAKLWTNTDGSESQPLLSTTVKPTGATGFDGNDLQAFAAKKR